MSFSRTSRLIGPAFEHATVADAMRTGIISCQADTSLSAIAELMASYHVHAVVVEAAGVESGAAPGQGWGIVSDVELARAAARGELQATAGELAGSDAMFIGPAEPLRRAAELMSEHRVSHLIVSTAPTARPVGIISTLDLAVALAWGRVDGCYCCSGCPRWVVRQSFPGLGAMNGIPPRRCSDDGEDERALPLQWTLDFAPGCVSGV